MSNFTSLTTLLLASGYWASGDVEPCYSNFDAEMETEFQMTVQSTLVIVDTFGTTFCVQNSESL